MEIDHELSVIKGIANEGSWMIRNRVCVLSDTKEKARVISKKKRPHELLAIRETLSHQWSKRETAQAEIQYLSPLGGRLCGEHAAADRIDLNHLFTQSINQSELFNSATFVSLKPTYQHAPSMLRGFERTLSSAPQTGWRGHGQM